MNTPLPGLSPREQRRDQLLAYMQGVTVANVSEMSRALGFGLPHVNIAIRDVRDLLGELDTVNLICEPGQRGRWQWDYRLVGTLSETSWWVTNRVDDAERRCRTMHSVLRSIVRGTTGRTTTGKKARAMEKAVRRLVEDLDDIEVNGVTP